jgi:hypothetical protein
MLGGSNSLNEGIMGCPLMNQSADIDIEGAGGRRTLLNQ